MTRIELSPQVFDDFDRFFHRLFDHSAHFDAGAAPQRMGEILQAIDILTHSPLIGRPVSAGNRELVIGRAARGYVALYRYVAAMDTVFVLAVRAQREDGFKLPP
jgi:plasmid stabilization system protein ParE